ncbi:MAG TPA: L,D-transpeptidase, partial [Rhizobiaceae bacterium]|nr:L,D-transpeptidase [Rhizobiaceae bacterium]
DRRLGSHVYTLVGGHGGAKGMHWSVISHSTGSSSNAAELAAINHVQAEHEFVEAMKQHMHPGMLLVLTDQPLDAAARSSGFTIATG